MNKEQGKKTMKEETKRKRSKVKGVNGRMKI